MCFPKAPKPQPQTIVTPAAAPAPPAPTPGVEEIGSARKQEQTTQFGKKGPKFKTRATSQLGGLGGGVGVKM